MHPTTSAHLPRPLGRACPSSHAHTPLPGSVRTVCLTHRAHTRPIDRILPSPYTLSSQVLVMEQGELVEYDHPARLLADRDTMFSKLVDKTGVAAAEALRKMANDHYASGHHGAW